MKNIFEMVDDRVTGLLNLDRELSFELKEELDKVTDDLNEAINKLYKVSKSVGFSLQILIWCPILLVSVLINGLVDDLTFIEELINHKWLYIIGIVLELVVGLYFLYKLLKMKKIKNSEEIKEKNKKSEEIYNKCIADLKIPSNYIDVDYLLTLNDKSKKQFDYYNQEMFTFIEDESLCIATLNEVHKIPLSEIKDVSKTDINAKFINWNKPTKPKHNKYYNCKVTIENGLVYKVKVMQINIENPLGNYYIALPEYEYQVIKDLLNR